MNYENVLKLSDQELLEFYDIPTDTPDELRAMIREMDTQELVEQYLIGENQTPAELRQELLALEDQLLLAEHDIYTPDQLRKDLECHRCLDCKQWTDGEYYMIHPPLWDSIADQGMLCIGCLEQRLGRELVPDDFTDAPINTADYAHNRSIRLNHRLGHDVTLSIDYNNQFAG